MLVFGDRGTGKSTAVRALAALLPPMRAVAGCAYACDPVDAASLCPACAARRGQGLTVKTVPVPVVDLPLGATEDRVVGALDIGRALGAGEKAFEPGCSPAPTGAFSTSTRSTCSRTTSSTCSSTWRPPA